MRRVLEYGKVTRGEFWMASSEIGSGSLKIMYVCNHKQ
jgi:hypothetical protein